MNYENIIPPIHVSPGRGEIDFTVTPNGTIRNIRTLEEYVEPQHTIANLVKREYRLNQRKLLTIGVIGDHSLGDTIKFCNGYSENEAICYRVGDEFADLELCLVGLTPDATIRGCSLGEPWHKYGKIRHLELHDLRIQAHSAYMQSAVKTYTDEIGKFVMNHCCFLPYPGTQTSYYQGLRWGFHIDHMEEVVIQDCYRGEVNGVPVRYHEHWGYLLNMGKVYILRNDIAGGNRTGFQYRSFNDGVRRRPWGHVLIEENFSDSYGMDWPDQHNGGSAMTVWCNPDHQTIIRRNIITNARYGCCAVTRRSDTYYNRAGYSHKKVIFDSNVFTQHPDRGTLAGYESRTPVQVSDCESVEFHGAWDIQPTVTNTNIVLNAEWAWNQGANYNLETKFFEPFPTTYNATGIYNGVNQTYPREVLNSYYVGENVK